MSIVRIKTKYQVVIPESVRRQIGVEAGDVFDAKVERGKITLTPKSLVDREIAEGLADLTKGRTYGPYGSADEMVKALRELAKKGSRPAKKQR